MRFGELNRREFITLVGGAAAWPAVARAQQGGPTKRVGFLTLLSLKDEEGVLAAFVDGLRSHGLIEGKNLKLDYRYSEGDVKRLTPLALELVALRPDALVGGDQVRQRCSRALHQHCQSFVPSSPMHSFPTWWQATRGQGAL
jgi:hypothetical protein